MPEYQENDKTHTYAALTPGAMVSHYRIVEKIGAGGMGEVYLAEDTQLNRKVALKFLPSHFLSDPNCVARFKREAQAAAKLSHPNIVTIHEVGEYQRRPFFVMEHVKGKSARDFIDRSECDLGTIVDLAIQICEGLQEAHRAGIVHRDIKPSNILITESGRAKLVDFGLAALTGAERLTKTGSTLGTVEYMSPEQAWGRQIDHRSDIFSLGVVLYEMITGRRPFKGQDDAAILHAITHDTPEPLERYKAGVPDELQRIVTKLLQKDPILRYQSAADVISDLTGLKATSQPLTGATVKKKPIWKLVVGVTSLVILAVAAYGIFKSGFFTGEKPTAERKMLAVLPFENLGAPEQEYFADGITEEITTHLAQVSSLGVISRTSVLQYKDTKKTVQQIGKELGVQYVLEGTILWDKSGGDNRVRINPQLIRVKDGTHVWAEAYDRALDQIFALQSDVAEKVVSALGVALLETEKRSIAAKPTENLKAYEYYLQGNKYSSRGGWTAKDARIAIEMYERAVELDPTFALAYVDISVMYSWMYQFYYDRTDECLDKAKRAVDRALELNPDLPSAHRALGYYYYWGSRDYDRALEEFSIALKAQPNNRSFIEAIGFVQRRQGKFEQAVTILKKSLELYPRSQVMALEIANTCEGMRKYADAEHYYDQALSIAPDWALAYDNKARLYIYWDADKEKARKVLQEASRRVDVSQLVPSLVWLDILDNDYQKALGRLSGPGSLAAAEGSHLSDTLSYFLTKAQVYGLLDQPQLKLACFDSARIILEKQVQLRPEDAHFRSQLGLAYAGLGRKEEAIREGQMGVELLPVSKDAWDGPDYVQNLARIYVMVGDYDSAIDQLEYLLSIPTYMSIPYLRIDPTWAPLRNHLRFQKLLEKHGT
jgi:serine/threonine protein kinase/tetratricopeptide (TPR) repeat protein